MGVNGEPLEHPVPASLLLKRIATDKIRGISGEIHYRRQCMPQNNMLRKGLAFKAIRERRRSRRRGPQNKHQRISCEIVLVDQRQSREFFGAANIPEVDTLLTTPSPQERMVGSDVVAYILEQALTRGFLLPDRVQIIKVHA